MKKYLLLILFLLLTLNAFCVNTLTNSTSGKLAFEDWAGQSQGSLATSTDYTFNYNGTQAYTWTVSGAGGKLAVVNSSAVRTWMYLGKTITSNSAILQASTLIKSGADGWFSTQNRGGTGGSSSGGGANYDDNMPRLYQRYYGTGTFVASNPIGQSDTYPTQYFTWTYDIWYNTKYVYKDNKCLYAVYRDSNNQLLQELSNENYLLRSYGTGYRSFNPNDFANKTYLTNLLICSDNIATFTGLTPTARVNIFNAAETSLLYSSQVTATANNTVIDFAARLFPVNSVIQIVGTDGSQLTKTAAVNIYGGDIWTYSGDFNSTVPTATPIPTNTPVANCSDFQVSQYGYPAVTITSKGTYIPVTGMAGVYGETGYVDVYMPVTYSAIAIDACEVLGSESATTTTAQMRISCISQGVTQTSTGKIRSMSVAAEEVTIGHNYIFPITVVGYHRIYLEACSDNGVPIKLQDMSIIAQPLVTFSGNDRYLSAMTADASGITSNGSTLVTVASANINATNRAKYLIGFTCNDTGYVGGSALDRTASWSLYIDGVQVNGMTTHYLSSGTDIGNPKVYGLSALVDAGYHTITARFINSSSTANRQTVSFNNVLTVRKMTSQNGNDIHAESVSASVIETAAQTTPKRIIASSLDFLTKVGEKILTIATLGQYRNSAVTTTAKAKIDIDGLYTSGSAERYFDNSNDRGTVLMLGRTLPQTKDSYVTGHINHYSDNAVSISSNNLSLIMLGGCAEAQATPTVTPTATPTFTPTFTPTIYLTATVTPTQTRLPASGGKVINEMGGM